MDSLTTGVELVRYLLTALIDYPESLKVEGKIDERGVLITVTPHPEDLGRVIGKQGTTAQSLRTVLRALGTKMDAHYNLKVVDNA